MSTSTIDPARSPVLPGSDVVADVLTATMAQLGRVVDVPTFAMDDASLLDRLGDALQVRAAVEELVARLVKEIDDRDLPRRLGASSTRAYLQTVHRMSAGQAGGITTQARAIRDRTNVTRRAWADGQICGEQAVVIAGAVRMLSASVDPAAVEDAQSDLIAPAGELGYQELRHVANHLVEVIDPDTADAVLSTRLEAEEARAWQGHHVPRPDRPRRDRPVLRPAAERSIRHAQQSPASSRCSPPQPSASTRRRTSRRRSRRCAVRRHRKRSR